MYCLALTRKDMSLVSTKLKKAGGAVLLLLILDVAYVLFTPGILGGRDVLAWCGSWTCGPHFAGQ